MDGRAPRVKEVAALLRVPRESLTRAFQRSYGISLGAYLHGQQIERAKALLRTDASLLVIGRSCGFVHARSFYRAFRRAVGMSPREYGRRMCLDKG